MAFNKGIKIFSLEKDLNIFCVKAKSFPFDIRDAFSELIFKLDAGPEGRTFFGISYQDSFGEIVYKASVLESFEGEGKELGYENFTIPKGEYLSIRIPDWKKDKTQIGTAFRELTSTLFDFTFPCVEWYLGNDVLCMVKLK